MSAIETCRTAIMAGHVEACTDCGHWRVAYNSCRNRHCPRCQGAAARTWLAEREADLLPVGYFHVVFTLPTEIADIALQNKAAVYGLLFQAASETMTTIAADPKHLGARIGITAVLHTWGSAMTHHPHIHMIVPGGGLSSDGSRWISSRPAFLLPVRVLGKLFRRLFLTRLTALHEAGRLAFYGNLAHLADRRAFLRQLAPVRKKRWVVYAKPPFAGPETVLAYLSLYSPGRHLEQPPPALRRERRHVPLQGLSPRRCRPAAGHDARRRRVHPPLPAKGLPPHPSLWPARRRHPQGPSRPRPPAARGRAQRHHRCAGRPDRRPAAMPMLRGAHGRHRNLRALVPTTSPSARHHVDRNYHVMTRHGSASSRHTVPALPATTAFALALAPPAPASSSCPGSGQHRCRTPLPAATYPPASAHLDRRHAHLATGPNQKTS